MDFATRLRNYAFQNFDPFDTGHRRKVIRPDGLTPRQYKRLVKKDRHQWAAAQASETTRGHR